MKTNKCVVCAEQMNQEVMVDGHKVCVVCFEEHFTANGVVDLVMAETAMSTILELAELDRMIANVESQWNDIGQEMKGFKLQTIGDDLPF